ncbi:MAG: hypothetical protein SGI74_02460 [Oligoflexia bacterium]|nr:hypothetical protein [Oligoflexia bacterium]
MFKKRTVKPIMGLFILLISLVVLPARADSNFVACNFLLNIEAYKDEAQWITLFMPLKTIAETDLKLTVTEWSGNWAPYGYADSVYISSPQSILLNPKVTLIRKVMALSREMIHARTDAEIIKTSDGISLLRALRFKAASGILDPRLPKDYSTHFQSDEATAYSDTARFTEQLEYLKINVGQKTTVEIKKDAASFANVSKDLLSLVINHLENAKDQLKFNILPARKITPGLFYIQIAIPREKDPFNFYYPIHIDPITRGLKLEWPEIITKLKAVQKQTDELLRLDLSI